MAAATPRSSAHTLPGLGPSALEGWGPRPLGCQKPALHLDMPAAAPDLAGRPKGASWQRTGLGQAPRWGNKQGQAGEGVAPKVETAEQQGQK